MSDTSWKEYFEKTKDRKPRPYLVKALAFVKNREEALDLGSGALNDVRYLVSEGFKHVTAVDGTPIAEEIIRNFPSSILSYVVSTFENFAFPKAVFDLVNAQYALPFNPPATFNRVFGSIIGSLKEGGAFTGQFFGINDEWNTPHSNKTFHTRKEVEALLSPLNVLEFTEEEKDEKTAKGVMKHWHVFHVIAVKK